MELDLRLGNDPNSFGFPKNPSSSSSQPTVPLDFPSILQPHKPHNHLLPHSLNNSPPPPLAAAASRRSSQNVEGSEDDEEEEEEDMNLIISRKKLRLSRQQSAFLEQSFKQHHTLYPKQKVEVARRLNLRPRQVEVWFQNRRARTKLKQTEVECEYLKKWCDTLTQQNTKLQKELQDLRALKTTHSLFIHSPPTTLTLCASCQRAAPTPPISR